MPQAKKEAIASVKPFSGTLQVILAAFSCLLVAFSQPAWFWWCGVLAAAFGYALFWRVLLEVPHPGKRFFYAALWFTCVQLVQLSWAISHPYLYIYIVYFFFAAAMGAQFGVLGLFITLKNIQRWSQLLFIAALWILQEWARLYFFSGFSWNPVGLALTGNLYSLQLASIGGVYGLSFWVILSNLLFLKAWCERWIVPSVALWGIVAVVPYFYGVAHVLKHDYAMAANPPPQVRVALIQTTFPADSTSQFKDRKSLIAHIIDQWRQILVAVRQQEGKEIDLIVLPEYAVPCGTYTCLYPYSVVANVFKEVYGPQSQEYLPPVAPPFAQGHGTVDLVNNAFWAQAMANYFGSGLVIGLEDVEDQESGKRDHYSAAMYFKPADEKGTIKFPVERYEKRVLVPLGEYIPFSMFQALAADYGIQGSFTSGKEAKVFVAGEQFPFGLSICYEETFGDIMRENKQLGAVMLVNLTSDAWYPYSRLSEQHFYHARLRTVENGIPLVRASNIGLTGAVDSLGRTIKLFGEDSVRPDSLQGSILIDVPLYIYPTIYSHLGDGLVIGICLASFLFCLRKKNRPTV